MPVKPSPSDKTSRAYLQCVATGISLTIFLVLVRFQVLGLSVTSTLFSSFLPKAALTGYYDVLYAMGLTACFAALLLVLPGKRRTVNRVYLATAALSLLAALANVKVVKMLGAPFNYQWFYYADFLNSTDTLYSSLSSFSGWDVLEASAVGAAAVGALLLLAAALSPGLYWFGRRTKPYAPAALLAVGLGLYLPAANHYIHKHQYNPNRLTNPVTAFVGSLTSTLVSAPNLYTRSVPAHRNEFLAATPGGEVLPGKLVTTPKAGIRNVVFFVLESVAAEYVGNPKYTPELCKHLPQAAVFSNVYTHCPSTHISMAAMLTSSYPWISYKCITKEYPSIVLPSLSGELKQQGFRTAFMHASDNRFQRMDEFLGYRGFDAIEDLRTLSCAADAQQYTEDYEPYLNGVDDACLVRSFDRWLGKGDTTKPFFAMLWTMQTHFPYFLDKAEQDMGVKDKRQNRYLNSLRHSDMVLGNLLAELKRKGLYESTLVVVVADHGEAFNDHNQYGHGSAIYEENVHVPLVLINPLLFNGQTHATLGGHVDVAPTVMELLGLPSPAEWEGNSLFAANRRERTYFFAPWTDFKFGYRQGPYKVIYNATLDAIEVFNVTVDPDERHNLAGEMPELVDESYDRLAAWVQYQNGRFQANLQKSGLQ
jgi:phosphoglycerol transferase MdoB-like AlkP superfamily enzyme